MTRRRPEHQRPPGRLGRAAVAVLSVALLTGACGDGASGEQAITVSAASSLRDAFAVLGAEAEEQGVEVSFNFDASSSLATQIIEGAPADVYASAAPEDMARLEDAGLASDPVPFARNALVIVTAPGNPQRIASLGDLTRAGVVSLCGRDVPCGRYAQRALDAAGVEIHESRVTRGQNAAATITAVAEGDADAGVAYVTDARSVGDAVATVPIPDADDLVATYLITVLDDSPQEGAARDFIDLVLSDHGQDVLQEHGFLRAP